MSDTTDFQKKIKEYAAKTAFLRTKLTEGIESGKIPEELPGEVEALRREEEELLNAAVTIFRRKALNTKKIRAERMPLVKDISHLGEADLPEETAALSQKLVKSLEEGDSDAGLFASVLPDIPKNLVIGGLTVSGGTADAGDTDEEDSGIIGIFGERFGCMPVLCARNEKAGFLFGDDGSLRLMENDGGFMLREDPVLTDCFAENAVMETDHSCLIVNLDHGIDRISYPRIESGYDLLQVPLYGDEERFGDEDA